jgi:uncharacterized protein (DUF4415 family)
LTVKSKIIRPLTNKAGEVRELTAEDFRRFRPTYEVLPELVKVMQAHRKRSQRGAQIAPTKIQVTLRLDKDVVERFRATGAGWQSRINAEQDQRGLAQSTGRVNPASP